MSANRYAAGDLKTMENDPMRDYRAELFAALQRLLPHHTLSRLTARLADAETPWLKNFLIRQFIRTFHVDLSEALEEEVANYPTFNAFFVRRLKAEARPLEAAEGAILCPADGTLSQIGTLAGEQLIQAKGLSYSAAVLLGDEHDAHQFTGGSFATIYLSPQDYHRVHMPTDGTLLTTRHIPGRLFSVNDATARHIPGLFRRNERLVCLFDTPVGKMAVVLVGAMLVAGIGTVWQPYYQPDPVGVSEQRFDGDSAPWLAAGAELGRFNFGSTVIVLFPPATVRWQSGYRNGDTTKMGKKLGTVLAAAGH